MAGYIGTKAVNLSTTAATVGGDADIGGDLTVDTSTLHVDSANNRVGVGTSSPNKLIELSAESDPRIRINNSDTSLTANQIIGGLEFYTNDVSGGGAGIGASIDAYAQGNFGSQQQGLFLAFSTRNSGSGETNTERLRIDSSGNLLVGTTDSTPYNNNAGSTADNGIVLSEAGWLAASRYQGTVAFFNRTDNDGDIAVFRKDGSTSGVIGVVGSNMYIGSVDTGLKVDYAANAFHPCNPSSGGSGRDNVVDLGKSNIRFNDAFITNGVTTGSDGNDKQDIRDLTEAEQRVAVACKGLLKAWRWKSAVEEKGDDARIHVGIIAQDLQAAFAAEGLDAGRYAMFMSNTWWEHDVEVPAVEAVAEVLDEEGNVVTEAVEAKDAYTRTDTYDTQEEAPEGATERTRLGVRYSELLAFIIGAL